MPSFGNETQLRTSPSFHFWRNSHESLCFSSHVTVAEAIHFIDVCLPRAGKFAKSKIWSSNSNNSRTRWSPGLLSPQAGTCMTRDAPSTGEMTFETTSRACPNCKVCKAWIVLQSQFACFKSHSNVVLQLQEILHEALKTHAMRSNLLLISLYL